MKLYFEEKKVLKPRKTAEASSRLNYGQNARRYLKRPQLQN